jgi:CheY-like chemotaxis protein
MADAAASDERKPSRRLAARHTYRIRQFAHQHGIAMREARELIERIGDDPELLDAAADDLIRKRNGRTVPDPAAGSTGTMSKTILIVEDDPFLRVTTAVELEEEGWTVLEAFNADEAIEILERRSDIGAVVTDVLMPGHVDGMGLASSVKERWPNIALIVTSGQVRPRDGALPDGTIFLSKPCTVEQLLSALGASA